MLTTMRRNEILALLIAVLVGPSAGSSQDKALTFEEMMRFRAIERPVISRDGRWLAYGLKPDRGDGELVVRSVDSQREFRFARGTQPLIANDGSWIAVRVRPEALAIEKAGKNADKLKDGLGLLNTGAGDTTVVEAIDRFQFTEDSRWIIALGAKKESAQEGAKTPKDSSGRAKKSSGTDLTIRRLGSAESTTIPLVKTFSVDSLSRVVVYGVEDSTGSGNGLFFRRLEERLGPEEPIVRGENLRFTGLVWGNRTGSLAYVAAELDEKEKPMPGSVWIWELGAPGPRAVGPAPAGWIIPSQNQLEWSRDGERLYLGLRPDSDTLAGKSGEDTTVSLFDIASILKKREVDIWHWDDGLINSHQKKQWKEKSERVFRAVYSMRENSLVQLADTVLNDVSVPQNSRWALGRTSMPYQKEITWDGEYADYVMVDQRTAQRRKFLEHQGDRVSLSPDGRFAAFFRDSSWHLYDVEADSAWNATQRLGVPFYNEDDDTPGRPGSYGSPGWMTDGSAVLVFDRFDIWSLPTHGGAAQNLTHGEGRKRQLQFRSVRLDPHSLGFAAGDRVYLSAYHDREKYEAMFSLSLGKSGPQELAAGPHRYSILAKAAASDRIVYTRESYTEFPDLWVVDPSKMKPKKLSEANPEMKQFAWGQAELVEWNSLDGKPLQGVLIKPGNYAPGVRYPVIVYFYELMSDRLHAFNEVVVNHRPCFPFYASNGYAVFLPDVRYDVGMPGFSATKCVVPGVQKLIDMGIADPQRIGLHGHSWGGYETAFIITQTDIFKAAIAGAAVGNMTSAYSGIRWGTGLARQFQYEKSQSRIGGSLWEYPERFVENSPIFFADRITTPLLLMHGDDDDAVPWYQSIELYLALRRLGKECILLQYRSEPHHPRKYPNKLDYAIRMKEYFDHYLKGQEAPAWITQGVPYMGK